MINLKDVNRSFLKPGDKFTFHNDKWIITEIFEDHICFYDYNNKKSMRILDSHLKDCYLIVEIEGLEI